MSLRLTFTILKDYKNFEPQEGPNQISTIGASIGIVHFKTLITPTLGQADQHIITVPGPHTRTTKSIENVTKPTMGIKNNATHTNSPIKSQTEYKKLPLFLLSNIQSFGNSDKTDKTTEVAAILNLNNIDIAFLTETWLNEYTKDQI
jgi:hypothetical protein